MQSQEHKANELLIIIPTTKLGEMIRGTLETLKIQTFQAFDTLIVANGVDEEPPWWMAEEFPFVDVQTLPSRAGFAAAVNAGIRTTHHPLIFLLNDDARPAPDCLAHLMEAQEKYSEFAGFASRICFYYSPSVLESAGDGFSLAGRGFHRGWRANDGPPYDREEEVFGACAAAALYRREIFDEAGLFEEDFFAVHEDVDLAFRARRKGFRFLYLPQAKVLHKGSVTLGTKSEQSVYLDSRNSELVLLKNLPFAGFLKIFPWYILYTYHAFFCAFRNGRLWPYLRGKFHVLGRIGRMLRKGTLIELEATVPFDEVAEHFDQEWHWQGLRRVMRDWRAILLALSVPILIFLFLYWFLIVD